MASSSASRGLRIAAALSAICFAAAPVNAGLNKGSVTVDSATVYLGVVPAVETRFYAAEQNGDMEMGGPAASDINSIHLVVALFDHGSGKRITDAQVRARFLSRRGHRWSVPLKPMTMNGAMTYGAYSKMTAEDKASIFIDVIRPFQGRTQNLTARFEYVRD